MTLWAVARACGAGDPGLQHAPPPFAALGPAASGASPPALRAWAEAGAQGGAPRGRAPISRLPDGFLEAMVAAVAGAMRGFGPQVGVREGKHARPRACVCACAMVTGR